jgi:hypothetical protein
MSSCIDPNDYCCDNTWLKNCLNKTFTYGQLLGAMKLVGVKYSSLPDDVKPKMFEYLKQQGYLRPAYFKQAVRNKI